MVFWGISMLFCLWWLALLLVASNHFPLTISLPVSVGIGLVCSIRDQIQSLGHAGKTLSYKGTAPVLCVCVCLLVVNWLNLLIDYNNHSEVSHLTIWVLIFLIFYMFILVTCTSSFEKPSLEINCPFLNTITCSSNFLCILVSIPC